MSILMFNEANIRVAYPRDTNQIYHIKCEDQNKEGVTLQVLKLLVAIQHTEE